MLDTHVLVRWVGGETDMLSEPALHAIERERIGGEILISSISAWEIAMLISRGRLLLSMDVGEWLATVSKLEKLSFISVDNDIAVNSTELPGEFHKDPADRIIVATSRKFAAPLVTADQKLRDYRYVKTIW
ncbi:type II toxin-antitoxin system VapC family toxin [Mesorhizobium sp. M0166]|uniref:type II toxin-antitoxin system VapC family toxin n=1 Tax=unclassified Mesorhizobium TaxID=325217 RepID=UPI00333CDCDF